MGFFRKAAVLTYAQERQITAMSKFYGIQHQKLIDQVFADGLDKWFTKFSKVVRPENPPRSPNSIKPPVKK